MGKNKGKGRKTKWKFSTRKFDMTKHGDIMLNPLSINCMNAEC